MRHFTRLLLLSLAGFVWVAAASADNIVSFGTNTSYSPAPSGQAGAINSALTYLGYSPNAATLCPGGAGCKPGSSLTTYDISTGGGVWSGPVPGSSWVSFENSSPVSGNPTPADGTYTFKTVFDAAVGDTLSLSIYADDTTSIYLNGVQIIPDTPFNGVSGTGKCDAGQPNCTMVDTVEITGFTDGLNTLTFGVDQDHDDAMGLDFSGTLAPPAPEPSSLMLLGTGLLGAAGAIRRRIRG